MTKKAPAPTWGKYAKQFQAMARFERENIDVQRILKRQAKRGPRMPDPTGIDWLVFTLGKIADGGGVSAAARKLGVDTATIYNWINKGVGHLPFERVVELADRANIPIDLFRQRMGPNELPDTNNGR